MVTQDKMKGTISDAAGRAHQGTDLAAGKAHQATDTAADKAHGIVDTVTDYAGQAKDSVQHFASNAADAATHAKDAVVDWTSDAARNTGDYVRTGTDEVTSLIRQYPIAAIMVGVGIGFMLAKVTRV